MDDPSQRTLGPTSVSDDQVEILFQTAIAPSSADPLPSTEWSNGAGPISLELFNRALWERDPAEVARRGLERLQALVA